MNKKIPCTISEKELTAIDELISYAVEEDDPKERWRQYADIAHAWVGRTFEEMKKKKSESNKRDARWQGFFRQAIAKCAAIDERIDGVVKRLGRFDENNTGPELSRKSSRY